MSYPGHWWKCHWPDLKSAGLFRWNLFLNSLETLNNNLLIQQYSLYDTQPYEHSSFHRERKNPAKCREEKKFVFWFGAQFNSTLNFTPSGWLIPFTPDLHFRPPNRVSCQTHPLWLENADQCRRHIGGSSIAMLFSWSTPPSADISLRL